MFVTSAHGDVDLDYAALILEKPVGNQAGYFGILEVEESDLQNHQIHLTGYPALSDVELGTAKGMMHHAAEFKDIDGQVIQHYTDASGGNSGSPLYFYEYDNPNVEPLIVGIHSGGPEGNLYNHGTAIVGSVYDDILNWIEEGKAYLENTSGNS